MSHLSLNKLNPWKVLNKINSINKFILNFENLKKILRYALANCIITIFLFIFF